MTDTCKFCGQVINVPDLSMPGDGWRYCDCPQAKAETEREERLKQALINIDDLFGDECGAFGFPKPVSEAVYQILQVLAETASRGDILRVSISLPGSETAVITGAGGEIRVSRRASHTITMGS